MAADEESTSEAWRMMWGAKVLWPADMPDDILKMAVEVSREELAKVEDWQTEGDGAVSLIRDRFNEKLGKHWHCVVGKHFGSLVTHETRRMCFFYLDDKAVLLFKT
jgi:dynein light chain LC8-type